MEWVVLVRNQKCIEANLHDSYNKSLEILNYVYLLKSGFPQFSNILAILINLHFQSHL